MKDAFDELYADWKEEGRVLGVAEGETQGYISGCKESGISFEDTTSRYAKKFNVSESEARADIERFWK